MWQSVTDWLYDAWDSLTGWLPDIVRGKLGIDVNARRENPAQAAPSTGAASIVAGGAVSPGRMDANVRTEVIITGENLPPGLSVSAPKSQADSTRLDCGYMMAGF